MINVIVSSDPRYPVNRQIIQSTVLEVLSRYKVKGKVEIGVTIVGDRKMHEINKKYRGIDSSTNIITFALEDPLSDDQVKILPGGTFISPPDKITRLGDIILSYPRIVEDARLEGISVDEEIRSLVEHGVLHLLGFHHD